jgi:predicted ATP-grasp superfamily ATP-dependent carboligase
MLVEFLLRGLRHVPLPPLMILDANRRTSLGVVRSLGRLGVPIFLGSSRRRPTSGFSRYTLRRFFYPPIEAGTAAMHAAIIDHVRAWRPAVLMPVGSSDEWATIYAHYAEYDRLTRVVPSPPWDQFKRLAKDKAHLLDLAERHSVPVPRTFQLRTVEEALELGATLPYPVVLKPAGGTGGTGITKANNARELSAILARGDLVPLIQEFIDGEDVELTVLCDHGEPSESAASVSR